MEKGPTSKGYMAIIISESLFWLVTFLVLSFVIYCCVNGGVE
jgi:hypothetical protein